MRIRIPRRHECGQSNSINKYQGEGIKKLNCTDMIWTKKNINTTRNIENAANQENDSFKTKDKNVKSLSIFAPNAPKNKNGGILKHQINESRSLEPNTKAQSSSQQKKQRFDIGEKFKASSFQGDSERELEHYPPIEINVHILPKETLKATFNKEKIESLALEKIKRNQQADIETQLTKIQNNSLTEDVNLNKVQEIRDTLSRKYKTRTDFKGVFQTWDQQGKGKVDEQNIEDMLNRMGIPCNKKEVDVLMKTFDEDKDKCLNLQEFMKLIFYKRPIIDNEKRKTRSSTIDQADFKDKSKDETISHDEDRVKFVLRNKMKQLVNNFFIYDFQQKGEIDQKVLTNILRRKVDLQSNVISDSEATELFNKYKSSNNLFNYRQFIKELRPYKYQWDDSEGYQANDYVSDQIKDKVSKEFANRTQEVDQFQFDIKDIKIQDIQKDNASHLKWMKDRADKTSKIIQKLFNGEEDFQKFISSKSCDSSDKENNGLENKEIIHKNKLLECITNKIKESGQKVARRDLEGLLEMPIYNRHGYTQIKDIYPVFFNESVEQMEVRTNRRTRGVSFNMKNNEDEQINEKKRSITTDNVYNKELSQTLEKVENNLYLGDRNSYQLFNEFDQDKDGYVNAKDLKLKLSQMGELNDKELKAFESYLFKENKDMINVIDFITKVKRNMSLKDKNSLNLSFEEKRQDLQNKIQSAKEHSDFIRTKREEFKSTYNEGESQLLESSKERQKSMSQINQNGNFNLFLADEKVKYQSYRDKTSNSKKILFNKSFNIGKINENSIIGVSENCEMYMTEKDRFKVDRLEYQKNEKQKKDIILKNKLANIRVNSNILQLKKESQEQLQVLKEHKKQEQSQIQQVLYQQLASSKNNNL